MQTHADNLAALGIGLVTFLTTYLKSTPPGEVSAAMVCEVRKLLESNNCVVDVQTLVLRKGRDIRGRLITDIPFTSAPPHPIYALADAYRDHMEDHQEDKP